MEKIGSIKLPWKFKPGEYVTFRKACTSNGKEFLLTGIGQIRDLNNDKWIVSVIKCSKRTFNGSSIWLEENCLDKSNYKEVVKWTSEKQLIL